MPDSYDILCESYERWGCRHFNGTKMIHNCSINNYENVISIAEPDV